MSYENSKKSRSQRGQTSESAPASQLTNAGKRTLTASLPLRPASASTATSASAPVQQKSDPAAQAANQERAELTQRWIQTAMRPDLHPPPVQRKSAGTSSSGWGVALQASAGSFTSSLAAGTSQVNQMSEAAPMSASEIAQSGFSGPGAQVPYKSQMEQSFGRDFSNVRVYTGAEAAGANQSMGANAYTMGNQIAFKTANPSPALVAHELTHVVQQTEGGPAAHGGGSSTGIVTAGEPEAEAVEAAVASGKPASSALSSKGTTRKGIARDGAGGDSKFTMGMTFNKDGFEKSYEYTIWDRALPPIPTGIPGVFWMFQPAVKVAAKGGVNWGGDDAGAMQASVEVSGAFGVGITGGAPGVAEVYGVIEPGLSGSGQYKKSRTGWELNVGMALKTAGKIGVKLGGGILDYAFQLFDLELIKFTGINFDQNGFHPEKFGLAWGKDMQAIIDAIKAIINQARQAGQSIRNGVVGAGRYIGNSAADGYRWLTSWYGR